VHRVSGAGFWTPQRVVVEHQRPCRSIGRILLVIQFPRNIAIVTALDYRYFWAFNDSIYLLYLSTSFLWWQAVAAIRGVTASHTLRNNSRCTWQRREDSRNVDNTAIRRAFNPLTPCGSVTADVHGCPSTSGTAQAPSRDSGHPGGIHGRSNDPSPHHAPGCAAHPSIRFSPSGHGFSTREAHWKPLI
jgi:hypothetical protein